MFDLSASVVEFNLKFVRRMLLDLANAGYGITGNRRWVN